MADFTKLMADIATLSGKVDTLLAKQIPPPVAPPVDEQPTVDALDAKVGEIIAKIPE